MLSFLFGNLIAGILNLIFRIRMFNLSILIWFIFNFLTMPIIVLGELFADIQTNKNMEQLGYPVNKKVKYFYLLEASYIIWILLSFYNNLQIWWFFIIFIIYKFLQIGRLFYLLARTKAWSFICIFSYVIFAVLYFN